MPAASTPRPRHTSPASRHADRASAPEDPGNPEQSRNRCPTSREEEAVVFFVFLCERRVVNAVSAVSAFLRFRCGVVNAVSAVSAFLPLPDPEGKIINLAREHRATFPAEKEAFFRDSLYFCGVNARRRAQRSTQKGAMKHPKKGSTKRRPEGSTRIVTIS